MANKSRSKSSPKKIRPPQHQSVQPGLEKEMRPAPRFENKDFIPGRQLEGRVAVISGGDSGIGRAAAIAFAREGADVAILYLNEDQDARETADMIENRGGRCLILACDVANESACKKAIARVLKKWGKIDILVNNAAEQHPQESISDISEKQLLSTFRTNVFSMFFLTAAALPSLLKSPYAAIVNTTSVTAYRGSPALLDYSATKGAIVSFTRSLASQLVKKKIRVNAVAPGPIWTPLIPATFPADEVATFGSDSPMGRAGEPWECAECFVFLASEASSFMTGQVLHPNGGEIING